MTARYVALRSMQYAGRTQLGGLPRVQHAQPRPVLPHAQTLRHDVERDDDEAVGDGRRRRLSVQSRHEQRRLVQHRRLVRRLHGGPACRGSAPL